MGYQLVAISPDKPENLRKSIGKKKLTYKLLSDSKMNAAKAMGIAFQVSSKTNILYRGFGINLKSAAGESHLQLPVPSVFIVVDGSVEFKYVNPNYKVRLDSKTLLAAARKAIE